MRELIVAIDGPAGAGKSTVAKAVAKRLGLRFLDTGAMYRALALKAHRQGLGPDDGGAAGEIGASTTIEFVPGDPQRVILDGEDVTEAIRTPEIGELASALSAHSPVRKVLAERQKAIVALGGFTLEGRDTTTVVAPQAQVKVFLTATLDERTRRRHAELTAKGPTISFEDLKKQIADRDHRDSTRADSPLMKAPDAIEIVSDDMSVDEVVERIVAQAQSARM
ncbi:MAG: (d)CMP kinase [Fimbriimonadales bacterium]